MDPLILRCSDYIFALIASNWLKEFFIMNLSFKGGTVHLYGDIGVIHKPKLEFRLLIPYFHNTTLTSQLRIDRVRVCTIDQSPQSVNLLYLTAVTFYQCNAMDAPVDAGAAESDGERQRMDRRAKSLKRLLWIL